jgi:hypothetical protein
VVVDRHRAAMEQEQRLVCGNEIPDLRQKLDHAVVELRQRHQRGDVDREHDFGCFAVLDRAAGRARFFAERSFLRR